LNIISFLKCRRKKFCPVFKELLKFLPQKFSLSSQIYGFVIRDPRSGIRDPRSGIRDPGSEIRDPRSWIRKKLFRIPDPGVKKAPDPGSATLIFFQNIQGEEECRMPREKERRWWGVLLDVTALLLVLVPGVGGLEVDGLAAPRPLHVPAPLTVHRRRHN
jgi:hypothetical protein